MILKDLAKSVGVKGMFNVLLWKSREAGKLTGVKFIKTKLVNGKVELLKGTEFTEPCDMQVIIATGQLKQKDIL